MGKLCGGGGGGVHVGGGGGARRVVVAHGLQCMFFLINLFAGSMFKNDPVYLLERHADRKGIHFEYRCVQFKRSYLCDRVNSQFSSNHFTGGGP